MSLDGLGQASIPIVGFNLGAKNKLRIKEALKIVYPAAITMITGYFASGLGDGVTNMMGSLIRQFIPLIPVAWLLAKTMGIDVVWYAIWISEICGALYAIVRIWRLLKRKFTEI